MDSVTQALLGATTAHLGFRQKIGRDAAWAAALAAYAPDLDSLATPIFAAAGYKDPFMSVIVHRGLTHSLLMVPLMALVFTAAWWWVRRGALRGRMQRLGLPPPAGAGAHFGLLYACAFVAMLTHPLLDWCTSYGTQLWKPITSRRYAIDAVGIIDFIYTPVLLLTLVACYAVRKISPRRAFAATLAIGWGGFLLSSGYLAAGRVMHDLAVKKALELSNPRNVVSANAYPTIGTIFLWRTVVETDDSWIVTRIHHFANADRRPKPNIVPKQQANSWVDRARQMREVRVYDWFAMGQLRADYQSADGWHLVDFHDMRYAWGNDSAQSLWPLRVVFDRSGQVIEMRRLMERRGRSLRELASSTWHEIWDP